MKTHRKETIGILTKYLKSDDTEALDEAYDSVLAFADSRKALSDH